MTELTSANRLTAEERRALPAQVSELLRASAEVARPADAGALRQLLAQAEEAGAAPRDRFGLSSLTRALLTATALCRRVAPDRDMLLAILLNPLCATEGEAVAAPGQLTQAQIEARFGHEVARMVGGLHKVASLYRRGAAVDSDNFRRLLMAFADDIRVIIIMIVDRHTLMRLINHHPDQRLVADIAYEANYLYASLAHRLGLYAIKGELEDMSLKYTDRATYTEIAHQLNARKAERDAYIAAFIAPVKARLAAEGLKFDIKGRTKSIFSIWNKMKKQHNDLDHIYDLFAIRVILDSEPRREKSDCWLVYSVIADMYQPNPARMKDWISVPKSNGYESLHTTVSGPGGKWVEVQIRTRRMDLVAEKGLAAHWRYKGIKSDEAGLDAWMNNVRDILETADAGLGEMMRNFKMDFYDKEVFCFTPKGDLLRLPAGASVLDFAFHIHSGLGCRCVGARVNGKNEKISYRLRSGDTVEVNTSANQQPKQDWLNCVVTSKARTKIRQTLKERLNRSADTGRELLQRRFKNRKITLDEGLLSRLVTKLGFKTTTEFFAAMGEERLDVGQVADRYEALGAQEEAARVAASAPQRSAQEFVLQEGADDNRQGPAGKDVLVIGGGGVKGLKYQFARCCNPICGDDVFGFISSEGTVKIHRSDCPNAAELRRRYPYRVIHTRWNTTTGAPGQFQVTLRVVGNDDIGIVTNITSLITKEKNASVSLRAIAIDSHDGLFQGHLTVAVGSNPELNMLIKKIKTVKGVKDVKRVN